MVNPAVVPNQPQKPPRIKRFAAQLADKVLIPFLLVILGIVIFDPVKEWWIGPKSYKVYLVGRLSANREIGKLFRGVMLGRNLENLRIDGVDISVEEWDDESGADAVAKELVNKDDTLMVIGHVYSQRTIDALPIYMRADPPVPVIATKETNPNLFQKIPACMRGELVCPVLQMSPTDDVQARDGLTFALEELTRRRQTKLQTAKVQGQPPKPVDNQVRFLLVKQINSGNPSYADYLTDKYEGLLGDSQFTSRGAVHLGTVPVADANDYPRITDTIRSRKPDCLIYIGQFPVAKQFLLALQETLVDPSERPMVVLSDAAVNPEILEKGFGDLEDVYATYPLSSSQY